MTWILVSGTGVRRAIGVLSAVLVVFVLGTGAGLARPLVHAHAKRARVTRHRHERRHARRRHARPRGHRRSTAHRASVVKPPSAVAASSTAGSLTFDGSFSNGFAPWTVGGGGPQCANTGTPSSAPRLRGTFTFDTSNVGAGTASGEITLPADPDPATYPLEACDLSPAGHPLDLGSDGYYGVMLYVPSGWTIPNHAFYGVEFMEYDFQNIYGAPISFQLHADHITLALQTGACNNHATAQPGCAYHSNADNPGGDPGNLPAYYVIPTGAFREGAWNEILMHVHWASDSSGSIQTWYRVKGASAWTPSASVSGIPTVQWDVTKGCCSGTAADDAEAYTGALTAPMSIWLDNQVSGTTFSSVARTMP